MKKFSVLFISIAMLMCVAIGATGFAYAEESQEPQEPVTVTCADYYAPSVDNYGKASTWAALSLEARDGGGISVGFDNASSTDIRTNFKYIAYKLNGLHMLVENFTGAGFVFSLNSENRASTASANRLTVVVYNMPATDTDEAHTEICVRKGAWGTSNTAFVSTTTVEGAMPAAFAIKFGATDEGYVMDFNGTEVKISADVITEAVTNVDNVYLQFHPWTYGSTFIKTYSFDLVGVHGGEAICVDDLSGEEYNNEDGTVYAPTTKLINRYSPWNSFTVTDNENNGGVHVKFDGVTSSDIRTRTWIVYELDGFEIDFANFTGDGFLFSINGKSNSDNYSAGNALKKLRFAILNNEKTTSLKIHVGEYVEGNTGYAYEYEIPQKLPQNFGFRFSKADDESGDYTVKFCGLDFVISAENIEASIGNDEDGNIDKIYPQISGFGSAFQNSEFDIVNMHGSEVVCARNLTDEQKEAINDLKDDIDECVEDIQINKTYLDRLDSLIARYNEMESGLRAFITNYAKVGATRNTVLADDGYSDAIIIQEEIEDMEAVSVSKAYLDKITAIETAYEALSDDQKTFVTGYADLTAKKEALLSSEKYLTAIGLIEDINGIGEVTVESKATIESVRAAYDALDDGQKSFVTNYGTLTEAESVLSTLIGSQDPGKDPNGNDDEKDPNGNDDNKDPSGNDNDKDPSGNGNDKDPNGNNNDKDPNANNTNNKKKGCKGTVAADMWAVGFIALLGSAVMVLRKKQNNEVR